MEARKAWFAGGAVVLLAVGVALVLLLGSSSSSDDSVDFTGSGHPNVDASNARAVAGPIDSSTVSNLEVAWTLPVKGRSVFGSYASSPIVSKGVVYSQDLASNVEAIDLESGEVLWTKSYEQPSHGPNGVVVAEGRVYATTPTAAFALDQETGEVAWSVNLVQNANEGIDMAPGYQDGKVFVSTVPVTAESFYAGGGVGTLWALDAKTGKKRWHFDTVPKGLWGNPAVNSGGGLWYTPAFDQQGSVYFGVGNPGPIPGTEQDPWGSSRPGPNLYTDSLVKLDAASGKLQWYHQETPHDLSDWDLQNPPVLMKAGGRQIVVASGKSGFVLALDKMSGKVVWKRAVGIHNGHDKDGVYAMRGEYSKLKTPLKLYPGSLGGVIAPIATDGETLYVPVVNSPLLIRSQAQKEEPGPSTGELVALDAATGAVKWKHEFASPAFSATTVVNDIVFTTTADGTLYAFDGSSGSVLWETTLPAGSNVGVTVSGDTVIAPAGLASVEGQTPQLVAYRLGS